MKMKSTSWWMKSPPFNSNSNSLTLRDVAEGKPLLRKIGEFKYWCKVTPAVFCSVFISFFDFLDIPVFAPLLFGYFFLILYQVIQKQR